MTSFVDELKALVASSGQMGQASRSMNDWNEFAQHSLRKISMHTKKWFYAFFALALSASAWGLDTEPFSNEKFAELQADGELVLIDIFATWCPTCARQHEVLKEYRARHPDVNLHILSVDYDKDRQYVRQLRAPRQSTLLLYKGETQFWYSVAETREDVIFEAINRAADFE